MKVKEQPMREFAKLYSALDETNKTNEKLALLRDYFKDAPKMRFAFSHFLTGRRPRRVINGRKLAEWAAAEADVPDRLFSEALMMPSATLPKRLRCCSQKATRRAICPSINGYKSVYCPYS